jgi:hypothetical protein
MNRSPSPQKKAGIACETPTLPESYCITRQAA